MDTYATLRMRNEMLLQQLNQAGETLLRGLPIDRWLYERVHVGFEVEIQKQAAASAALRKRIQSGDALSECWHDYEPMQDACQSLFQEILAFLQGASARSAGLDNGLCQVADALLDELSHQANIGWGRFTVLAGSEFFTEMAQIVRIRFPEVSIWNLPIAVHEFGHFIGPELKETQANGLRLYPFQQRLERARLDGKRKAKDVSTREQLAQQNVAYLHERFADLFAVFALGPAYACTCFLLRFDPITAYTEGIAHPSTAQRAYWILAALKRMDQAEGALHPYQPIIETLENTWRQNLLAVGHPDSLQADTVQSLDELLNDLYNLLSEQIKGVRYSLPGWLRAQRLAGALQPDQRDQPHLAADDALSDIVNAAWLCRLRAGPLDPIQLHQIGQTTLQLCQRKVGAI